MTEHLPATYKRLMLMEQGATVEEAKVQIEEVLMVGEDALKMDEVVIKVAAAPVNPSDYGAWTSVEKNASWHPRPIGNEGAGIVVRIGSHLTAAMAGISIGSKVGFTGLRQGQGSYSEYVVAPLATTFVMDENLNIEDAASFFVNPYTAVGILDTVCSQHPEAKAFIHTAAASQLGKMLIKLIKGLRLSNDSTGRVRLISVVRNEEQAQILNELGADKVVIVKNAETDLEGALALREAAQIEQASVAFDAVAGGMTGLLMQLLPARGTCYVYGRLDGDIRGIPPIDLIYRQKQLKAFYLKQYLVGDGLLASGRRFSVCTNRVRPGLHKGGWCHTEFADCDMESMFDTFLKMKNSTGFTERKLRILFPK